MSTYIAIMALPPEVRRMILEPLAAVSDRTLDQCYRDMLNECYDPVSICGYEYEAADALASVDPVAYRCGYIDYCGDDTQWTEVDGVTYATGDLDAALYEYEESQ